MSRSETVWIVDDDRSIRWVLEKALQQEGMTTQSFDSADGVMSRLARQQPDVIISDIRMPGASGLDRSLRSGQRCRLLSGRCVRVPAKAVRR